MPENRKGPLAVGAAFLVAVLVLAVVLPAGPLAVDQRWSDAMLSIQTPFLTRVAHGFAALGHWPWVALVIGGAALALALTRRWFALVVFLVAELEATLISTLLKVIVDRPRPPRGDIDRATSFPSGHASFAAVTCITLVLLLGETGPRSRRWWALALAAVAGMAWSRTYLQVHWLSDVVAGALLGAGVSLVTFDVAKTWARAESTR